MKKRHRLPHRRQCLLSKHIFLPSFPFSLPHTRSHEMEEGEEEEEEDCKKEKWLGKKIFPFLVFGKGRHNVLVSGKDERNLHTYIAFPLFKPVIFLSWSVSEIICSEGLITSNNILKQFEPCGKLSFSCFFSLKSNCPRLLTFTRIIC